MNTTDQEVKKLNDALETLTARLEKIYSLKFVFLRGVITGIGTVIGASIVAAIVFTVILQFADLFGLRPLVEQILP